MKLKRFLSLLLAVVLVLSCAPHVPLITSAAIENADYNAIVNGNFDQGNTGWANNNVAPVATIADGVLKLATGKTSSGDARTYYSMQLAPGTYQLSFDVKGTPAQYRPYVGVSKNYWTNDYGQYFMYKYDLSDTEWTTVTETFTVPQSAADATSGLAPVYVTVWSSNTAYAPATEMQFDNFEVRKLLNVTTELSNAALGGEIKTVAQGLGYENTVVANKGYEISKVTVTMDGKEVQGAYDAATGKISISVVTGDLSVQVETIAEISYNLLINGNFDQGETGWGKNANFTAGSVTDGVLVLPTTKTGGDAIFYQSMNLAPGTYQLSFDGKGTANQYRPLLYIGINQWSKVYGEHFLKNLGFGEEWKTATVTFTIPETAADAATGLAPVYVALWTSNKTYGPETEMQLDNFDVRKLLNVTTELSNAVLGSEIKTVAQGMRYENTVTATDGYKITSVTVTMGGKEVQGAYDTATGKINIPVVTGDLSVKVETTVDYNLLINGNFNQGNTGWANNGIAPTATIADGVLKLSTGKTSSGDARTYYSMQLAPGTYQLSFDVKGTPAQYRPYVGVSKNYWTNDYGQYFMYKYDLSDTEWTTVTETFTVPESAADATSGLAPVYVTVWSSNTSYAPVTEMQFDNFEVRKLLNVTAELNNAVLGSEIKTVTQGLSYENTVTANDGYKITSVTVTMGGEEVQGAYDAATGKISIPVVTGDLVVTVSTETIVTTQPPATTTEPETTAPVTTTEPETTAPVTTTEPETTAPVTTTDPETTAPVTTTEPETTAPVTTTEPETTAPVTTTDPETTAPVVPPVDYAAGYDWIFDKTIESFGSDASFKTLLYGNDAQTLAFVNHEGLAASSAWGYRTLVGGLLTTKITASWAKEDAGMGIYYKLPADLKVGQQYILSLNIYALSEGTVLSNGKADSLKVSFNTEPKTTQAWQIAVINGFHNSAEGASFTVAGPEELSTDAANRFEIVFTATQAMVDAGDWMLISIPLPYDKDVVLGSTTLKEKNAFGNELVNGNFDQGETGWNKNGNFTAGSVTDGVLVIPTTLTNGDAIFYQSLNLAPGTYQLSFDGKGTANQYRPLLYIGFNQWSDAYGKHFLNSFGFGEDWKTAVITFTVPESAADAETGLAPVFISLWTSNGSYAPETEMQLDNFELRKCFSASVLNSDGQTAGGLKEFTLPNAAYGAPFDLTLVPLDTNYAMTVTATMGGKYVPVAVNADGSVTIHIDEVTGDVAIVADSVKASYTISTDDGLTNSSTVVEVDHGAAYSAQITCGKAGMKLYSVFYTMGTQTVAVPVVDGVASISIESVTGDVTISAILVDASIIAQWIFDADKVINGNSEWGNADKTITIANSTYNDGAGRIDRVVKPGCLTITSLCPPNNWSDAGSIVGFKLPSDLAVGKTYMLNLPLYAGNDSTTMVSSRPGSTLNGIDLIFTNSQPANMWAQTDSKRLYADGVGVLVSNSQSVGVLSQDANNVFCISFTVTEEIAAYAKADNWLTIFINHPHTGSIYNLGNVTMNEVTKPAAVSKDTGDSVCDGSAIAQIGKPYFAQIAPKAGYRVVSATYTMGGKTMKLEVVNGCAYVSIPKVTGDITIKAVTSQLEPENLIVNGTFILGTQFWSFENGSFMLMENGGSDKLDIPAHLQAAGMPGGLLSQAFKVEKNTNYQLTFRYKGKVPVDAALWAIASNQSFAWNSVIYKGAVKNAEDWTEVTVVFNSGNRSDLYLLFRTEAGSVYALDNIWVTKTDKAVTVDPYQRPVLGARPNPNPFNDYPYITDDKHNLMPDFGFETDTPVLENGFSQVEKTDDAWEGSNALHYATIITGEEAANRLVNGDLANWDPTNKTIAGWEFTNSEWMHKLDFVELDGRHAVKLNTCTGSDKFRMEMMQKVYLEAGFTYKFSFDYYGVSDWGPNLPIYDANQQPVGTTANSGATGTEGQWTTLTNTFTPATSGYYYFAVRIHNDAYPQREQYVSNCSVTLLSKGGNPRLDYELKDLKPNTDYWLTMFVKAPKVESVLDRFVTFGISDPETGDFIVMANPDSEGSRPYKVGQQLVPMAYDGQWHLITVPFNTGDATWLNFTITGTNCEVWFDNIYIFEAQHAKSYVAPGTEKDEATVTDETPDKLGVDEENNLFSNFNLNDGNVFWGSQIHKYGVFGNALNVIDSGSRIYGNALHYAGKKIPTGTYYIKWIDVEPNTEYTFSAKYSITQIGDGFVGLINGYRLDSEVTENRLFPTIIAEFGFGAEEYLETQEWQTIAVSFHSGERNRIGFVVCDAGGEAYIDELRLFKSSDGIELKDAADTFPGKLETVGQMVSVSEGVIHGIPAGTTLDRLLKHFANSEYIRVFDAEDVEITALNAVIGTGASVKLMDGPVIKDEASVLVVGDVNGDASVDAADSAAILDHISGKKSLEGIYLAAADLDADGTITVSDVLLNTKAPGSGQTTILAVGPTEFAQRAEIQITLCATAGLQALSGKLTPTDGLTFVKAEASADGWSLSSKRSGKDVFFAAASEKGNTAAETVLITFTFRVGMISTYDEAQVNFTELLGFDGTDLLAAPDLNWVRKTPTVEEPEPEGPIIVPAKNRLSKLELVGITLSPAFDPEIKEYTATVPFEIDEVTLIAEAADEGATLEFSDLKLEYVGRNTVAVRVTSVDGLRRTYRIIITRQPPTQQPVPETTAPVTTAPVPTVPETTVPETTVPVTTIPETTVPVTTVPVTTVPETTVPETMVPEPTVPETTVPATVAPTVPVPTAPRPTEPVTTEPDDGITEITIRVQVPEDWENPTVWAWNNAGENAFDAWPGLPLTKGADGYWYATVPAWVENVIIAANGGSVQTADIALEQTKSDVTVTVSKADDGSFKVELEYAPVEIPAPETTAPETTAPGTADPETTVPGTTVPDSTEPGDAEPDGPSVVGIVLISIAGAALLAALIILILYFRKKRNTTAQ